MSRTLKIILSLIVVILLALVGLFFAGNSYFNQHFYYNTSIGSVDVSGMTQAEAQSAVDQKLLQTPVHFSEQGNEVVSLKLGDFANIEKTEDIISDSFRDQHQSHWLMNTFNEQDYLSSASDYITIDQQALIEQLAAAGINNDDRQPSTDATIRLEGHQHVVQEESQGNQLDWDKVQQLVQQSNDVPLEKAYIQPEVSSQDESIQQVMDQIDKIAQTQYTLVIEDQEVTIPEEDIRSWIQLDENQQISLDQSLIYDYLGDLNLEYSTYAKERPFQSTYSGEVTVVPDKMGWWINREVESQQIAEELLQAEDVKREPEISGSHYGLGLSFGEDYIEVDMSKQKLMLYLDHELVLETDVVTGRPGSETIPGAKYVWDMQSPSVLRGFNKHTQKSYASPVNYWMPIDDHAIGIHDADWQSTFGGDTYLYRGSLGCINIPPSVMDDIFSLSYVGMPVAVF